jgi:hypothetical protein
MAIFPRNSIFQWRMVSWVGILAGHDQKAQKEWKKLVPRIDGSSIGDQKNSSSKRLEISNSLFVEPIF